MSLVRASLIRAEADDEQTRFAMLETIREYGLEQLAGSGEMAIARARYADVFLPWVTKIDVALTGSVFFASCLFYGMVTVSLFVFRKTLPNVPRPYHAFGYPVIPMIFVLVTAALLINTFVAAPSEALRGVALLAAGLPFYWYWSRRLR